MRGRDMFEGQRDDEILRHENQQADSTVGACAVIF